MLRHYANIKISIASMLVSLMLFAGSAFAQSPVARTDTQQKEGAAPETKPGGFENKVTAEPRPKDVQGEIDSLKAENAAVRELLRKMEEQQKVLLDQVDRLQQRLDGAPTANPSAIGQPGEVSPQVATATVPATNEATAPVPAKDGTDLSAPAATTREISDDDRYRDGILIWETSDEAKVPFQLRFTNITQFRYLNTLATNDTFTDHLGVVREVSKRNDLTINRSMFTFNGYIFDKRLRYNVLVWTSATTTQIVMSGNFSWQFNKALTLNAGYWAVPGTRTLTYTFPFFTQPERSLADNFFRPGFTQGIWATGEPIKGVNYNVFVGNGLNTLTIPSTKIDTNLTVSGSVWWEPFGEFGPPGKSRNMYDDYFPSEKPVVRIGTSFTRSREDRFSNLDQSNPENTSMHNSDGVLTFSTGAFAPGVTVDKATYRMWAIDGGLKWRKLAVNGQYYFRWLNDFEADGPLPVSSTFDQGVELSASHFFVPKKFMLYARGSAIFGQFGDSHEYAGGFKWFFLPTERIWLNGELMRVYRAAYGSSITPYVGGMTGWVPVFQTIVSW